MPANLDALLRYHTIDQCLQNRFRKWNWQNLAEACAQTLAEASYRSNGKASISQRTIQNDIRIMRSPLLGYNAPIEVKNGNYFYAEKDFSIKNVSLKTSDILSISAAIAQLKLYKGLTFFQNIERLLENLESQLHLKKNNSTQKIIQFENIPASTGTEWLNPLLEFTSNEQCITLTYKRFQSNEPNEYLFHPYFLKEYKNRWYVIGFDQKANFIKTFALDRILSIVPNFEVDYNRINKPDIEHYYDFIIGVNYPGALPERVVLKFNVGKLPYLKSQPLHSSQEIVEETTETIIVALTLCLNYELENLILSFADDVEVLEPLELKQNVKIRLEKAIRNFQ
jgi:predicted DNA-binding transcriptional regulator YafY